MANLQGGVHDLRESRATSTGSASTARAQDARPQLAAITNDVAETTNRLAMAEGDLIFRAARSSGGSWTSTSADPALRRSTAHGAVVR